MSITGRPVFSTNLSYLVVLLLLVLSGIYFDFDTSSNNNKCISTNNSVRKPAPTNETITSSSSTITQAPTNESITSSSSTITQAPTNESITSSSSTIIHDRSCLKSVYSTRNIHFFSQYDEDGAILRTIDCLGGHGTRRYFEFGSEDGTEVNTRFLREVYNWSGNLLDGSHEDASIPLHKVFFSPSNIVSLMERYHGGPDEPLDLLSVDCDYDDFWITREILVAGYRPRILIVEYNRNIPWTMSATTMAKPIGEEIHVWWSGDCYYGASARALNNLTMVFGYALVWSNGVNLIFVKQDDVKRFGYDLYEPEDIVPSRESTIHKLCDGKTWTMVDDKGLAQANDKNVSHVEFSQGFEKKTLKVTEHKDSSLTYRDFEI